METTKLRLSGQTSGRYRIRLRKSKVRCFGSQRRQKIWSNYRPRHTNRSKPTRGYGPFGEKGQTIREYLYVEGIA